MNKKYFLLFLLLSFVGSGSFNRRYNGILNPIDTLSLRDSAIIQKNNRPVAIVGDLQRTTMWELMIGREQNDPEREKILQYIAFEDPAGLILLGDMVCEGSDVNEWSYLRELLKPVVNKSIPIIPVLGNHEYWVADSIAVSNTEECFPVLQESHWYSRVDSNIVFIILDSNKDNLTESFWIKQKIWFENILKYYDSNPSIKGIIVCLHHPPYTNSIVTGDNINVQQEFLRPFKNSLKTMAMISGHAHTYERFEEKGKMFIVSGGGGGPRVILKTGLDTHKDLVNLPSPRPFNYLLLYLQPGGIKITAKGLKKDSSKFFTIDDFSLYFNDLND